MTAATSKGMARADAEKHAELDLLRTSLRRLFERHWSADMAGNGGTPEQRQAVWRALLEVGLGTLGSLDDASAGGWQELLLTMEELGRAACPAPMAALALSNELLSSCEVAQPMLDVMRSGAVQAAFSLGSHDGDADAGRACWEGRAVSGSLRYVEALLDATQLVVLALDGDTTVAVVVILDGLPVSSLPGLAVPPLGAIAFEEVSATRIDVDSNRVADLGLSARLLLLARAYGAARRMFDLAVEHAGLREQFGKPIGSFQAVQHKLANAYITLEAISAMLRGIGQWRDAGQPVWRMAALSALAAAGATLRQVALDAHQVLGAVGYDESHELPRHFRRVHADLARHGGVRRAERELADRLIDQSSALPDTPLGESGERFRCEVRKWLEQHWSAERKAAHDELPYLERAHHPEFERALGAEGWLGIAWPKEHGGQARTPQEQLAYIQELEYADAPGQRMSLQAPALMRWGTTKQQIFYLPRLLRGEIRICLGYSEAGAGSDLSALTTSAVLDGDEWVINGEKLWSTHATFSDYVWLAVRTDPQAKPRHAGISMFLVPLKDYPGVSIRPGMAMYSRPFSTIRFENVRVPREALVGPLNGGWRILTGALAEERIQMGSVVFRCRRVFDAMVAQIRKTSDLANKDDLRSRVGALAAKVEAARALLANSIEGDVIADQSAHAAAMSKVYSADLMQQLGEASLDLLGMQATLAWSAEGNLLNGELEQLLRHSLMYTIGGGTQEIQRNLIATRGLGLNRKAERLN
ncbi:acyl-CoA dehydrogenase [Ottowia thiooxydans]|uniref:acyl-CoA dehydrogenase n=1 Tax=Ottowia thiooxydans TaxID=219182 RepID=UPI00040BF7BC|nr:acyl-CoA dehydrogenase [Ottowia thiooxydans]